MKGDKVRGIDRFRKRDFAYKAGQASWHNGASENDCPYEHLSTDWCDWMAGFSYARDNDPNVNM